MVCHQVFRSTVQAVPLLRPYDLAYLIVLTVSMADLVILSHNMGVATQNPEVLNKRHTSYMSKLLAI